MLRDRLLLGLSGPRRVKSREVVLEFGARVVGEGVGGSGREELDRLRARGGPRQAAPLKEHKTKRRPSGVERVITRGGGAKRRLIATALLIRQDAWVEIGAYQGILFPDRAESIGDFEGYKVFLDPWDPLAALLQRFYEGLALRRETRILAVHGPQGSGKTLFARKLMDDLNATRRSPRPIALDRNNLWHRIAGGHGMSAELVERSADKAELLVIEDDPAWVATASEFVRNRTDKHTVIIADNAERGYFRQGLVTMTDVEFAQLASNEEITRLAAQKLVGLCRNELRGALVVLLSNDDLFLLALDEAVEGQHAGMLSVTELPLPGGREKETVVRVNINRLNRLSYWYCLDKAGPQEKLAVKRAVEGASTYPDSFAAVDTALRTASPARVGRPAKQNTITLVCLTPEASVEAFDASDFAEVERVELSHDWARIYLFNRRWCPATIGPREASLLESEWQLRIALLADPFVAALSLVGGNDNQAYAERCGALLEIVKRIHGPGTLAATREATEMDFHQVIDAWPRTDEVDLEAFWAQGQTRAGGYEAALARVLAGYNTTASGFLTYRPDYVVTDFKPCSILEAASDDQAAINAAIRRDAHVLEFTAQRALSAATVRTYLEGKLPNYVRVTQEQ